MIVDYAEWNKWWVSRASEYFTDMSWDFSQPNLINRLNIGKDSKVLEIGFGYGRELSNFCSLSNHVYGLELADWSCENALQELKSQGIDPLPCLQAYDGVFLPFTNDFFDAIYSCYVIQHLSRHHAKQIIKEAIRVLKPDGKVLFEFFGEPEYFSDGDDMFSGVDGKGGMFNNAYRREEITPLINSCGGNVLWIEDQKITENWYN